MDITHFTVHTHDKHRKLYEYDPEKKQSTEPKIKRERIGYSTNDGVEEIKQAIAVEKAVRSIAELTARQSI